MKSKRRVCGQRQPQEDEQLEAEKRVLANAEKIYGAAINAFDLLYEGNASTSSSLRAAQKHLEELARYEPKFQEALAALESARISVEDVGATLRDYAGGIQASPERLAEIEERLALLDRLKRKYGPTLEQTIAFGEDIRRKLSEMENKDQVLLELRAMLAVAAEEYRKAARTVSRKRLEAGRKLEKLVEAEINDLAMRASFRIAVEENEDEEHWTVFGHQPGRLSHLDQCGRDDASAGADCLGRRTFARHAGVEGERRSGEANAARVTSQEEIGSRAAHIGLRRNRYRHRRPRRRGRRQEIEGARQRQSGALRHPPAADRNLCRSPLPDRKARSRRPREDHRPPDHRRRAHRRSGAHVVGGEADRDFAEARGADDSGEWVSEQSTAASLP